jgi:hypothetical protein
MHFAAGAGAARQHQERGAPSPVLEVKYTLHSPQFWIISMLFSAPEIHFAFVREAGRIEKI